MLQEHIARAKKTRDDLLDESQKRLRMMLDEQSEYEIIKSKVEECKVKYPWVARNVELEKELSETKDECKDYRLINKDLERKLSEANFETMRLEGANVELNSQLKKVLHQLSVCQERLGKTKERQVQDRDNNDKNGNGG